LNNEFSGRCARRTGDGNYDHLRGVEQLERVAGERGLKKQAPGIVLMKSAVHGEHEKTSASSNVVAGCDDDSLRGVASKLQLSSAQAFLH
jgi:hypothetical protein